ncbi:MAG: Hsp20/alpha crystallin family protein [Bacteroidota bacterium]|nr:Hsp20/alpha crystallin family protein [Bacteroidota bacterium]
MTLVKWSNHPIFSDLFDGMPTKNHHHCESNKPAANIVENNDGFNIEFAVPGMNKSDFSIDLDENILTVSTSREEEKEEDKVNYRRREFNYRNFSRSFTISDNIDTESIRADYKQGVLSISLPKKEEAKDKGPKNIKVS